MSQVQGTLTGLGVTSQIGKSPEEVTPQCYLHAKLLENVKSRNDDSLTLCI